MDELRANPEFTQVLREKHPALNAVSALHWDRHKVEVVVMGDALKNYGPTCGLLPILNVAVENLTAAGHVLESLSGAHRLTLQLVTVNSQKIDEDKMYIIFVKPFRSRCARIIMGLVSENGAWMEVASLLGPRAKSAFEQICSPAYN